MEISQWESRKVSFLNGHHYVYLCRGQDEFEDTKCGTQNPDIEEGQIKQ